MIRKSLSVFSEKSFRNLFDLLQIVLPMQSLRIQLHFSFFLLFKLHYFPSIFPFCSRAVPCAPQQCRPPWICDPVLPSLRCVTLSLWGKMLIWILLLSASWYYFAKSWPYFALSFLLWKNLLRRKAWSLKSQIYFAGRKLKLLMSSISTQ